MAQRNHRNYSPSWLGRRRVRQFHPALLFHERKHLRLDKLRIQTGHRVVLEAPLAALGVAAAVADGNGNHHRHALLGDEIVKGREQGAVRPVGSHDKRRRRAGDILLGNINLNAADVGRGVAGGYDQFGRIGGIGLPEGVCLPGNARINPAVA